jgi:tripartite-type tricarboxylate transporter receptor subunit TctC
VTRFGDSPFVVMAAKGLGTKTLTAFIEKLKAEPGQHNYGWGSVPSRVATELLRMITDIDVAHVGYRGNQAAYPDLLNGRLSFMSVDIVGAKPLVDRGEVEALAVTSKTRHPAVPDVPNCVEAGLPPLQFTTWSGVYAPRATPPEIVAKIHEGYATAFAMPEVRARLRQMGSALESLATPAEFQAFTISEIAAWGRIMRKAQMRLE